MIVNALCTTLFAKLIKPMLDQLFIDKDASTIFWMPFWILGIFALRSVASYFSSYGMAYVGRGVVQAIREDVFNAYLRLSDGFFSSESSGTQIARITYTCEQVAQASTNAVKTTIVDGLTVIGLVSVMLYYSPLLTLVLLVMVPAVGLITTRVGRSYRKASQRVQATMGMVTGAVNEAIDNRREMRIYGGMAGERTRFSVVSQRVRQLDLKVSATNALSTALVQFVAALALALIIVIATRPSVLATMSPGTFFAVLMALVGTLPSLKRLTTVQASIQSGLVAAEDLFALIDTPAEPDEGELDVPRVSGHLQFRHASFSYPGAETPALRDIVMNCRPGTVTALVGRSGSGKSTLSSLIPRFLDPQKGAIFLDGHDLRDYTLRCLRRQMAWVGQSIPLFDGTVAQNIAYGELADASEIAIIEAARAANAWPFIEHMAQGLHSPIGPDGCLLSGGQRQRIAIARAILKNAPLLVLDEATSSLDMESEHLIQEALARLMRHRTTIVIAHRLSTIQHADQIIVIDSGHIIEHGTHASLLQAQGQYARLHQLQFA